MKITPVSNFFSVSIYSTVLGIEAVVSFGFSYPTFAITSLESAPKRDVNISKSSLAALIVAVPVLDVHMLLAVVLLMGLLLLPPHPPIRPPTKSINKTNINFFILFFLVLLYSHAISAIRSY